MRKIVALALILCFYLPSVAPAIWSTDAIIATVDQPHVLDVPPPQPQAGEWIYTPRVPGTITEIVVHHSGSFPYGPYDDAAMVAGYARYHKDLHGGIYSDPSTWNSSSGLPAQQDFPDGYSGPEGYNYNDIDYHYLVGTDAVIYSGRREDTVGWHASNWEVNLRSLGVCFVGEFDSQEPSPTQYQAGVRLVSDLAYKYQVDTFSEHSQYAAKSCPGYSFPWARFVADVKRETGIYPDCSFDNWFHTAVMKLGRMKLIAGLPDGTLRPYAQLSRAELCTILYSAAGSPPVVPRDYFPDILLHWGRLAIRYCAAVDLVNGYPNGLFYPDKPVTRAEAATIIARLKDLSGTGQAGFVDVPFNHWAANAINSCYQAGYLRGYPDYTFRPDGLITRAEAFALIARVVP